MSSEEEIFELLLARWKEKGRPSLAETARILLDIEATAIRDLDAIVARLLVAILSQDASLTEDWSTGTDAQRVDAVLEAYYRTIAKLSTRADQMEAGQR